MKVAGVVLGIVGGIVGFGSMLWKLFMGGIGVSLGDAAVGGGFIALGILTGVFSLIALIAACMTNKKPAFSGITQLIAAVLCIVTVSWFTFIFFLLGGIFAVVGWRQDVAAAAAQPAEETA